MDMANFSIQQIRPYIQQQSVEYEKKKFDEFLKKQQGTLNAKVSLLNTAILDDKPLLDRKKKLERMKLICRNMPSF